MARFEDLIPFLLKFESRLSESALRLDRPEMFEAARRVGFSDDPSDRGGATMCGVTLKTYRAYRKRLGYAQTTVEDLKQIPYSVWRGIYKSEYWDRCQGDRIENQAIANLLVDFVWHSGVSGIKVAQRELGVKADGVVGPLTLGALNEGDARELFGRIHDSRLAYLRSIVARRPDQSRFLSGWERRVNAITFDGLKLIGG